MRTPWKKIIGLTLSVAIAGGGIAIWQTTTQGGGGGAPAGTANVWMDTNGGTCTYSASPVVYNDGAACSTIDAGWDLMSAGNTMRIKNGTYTTQQVISGNKASNTFVTGESKAGVIFNATSTPTTCGSWGEPNICITAQRLVLSDVTSATGAESSNSGDVIGINASNVTFNNVDSDTDFGGSYVHAAATNFTWNGGTLGSDTPGLRACGVGVSDVSLWVDAANLTLNNLVFNPVENTVISDNDPNCLGDSHHFDTIRLQGNTSGFKLTNSYFVSNYSSHGGATTGHLFVTGGTSNNAIIYNNYFGAATPPGSGNGVWDFSNTCTGMQNWFVGYNTFAGGIVNWGACSSTGDIWVGNLGPDAAKVGTCANHIKNVWQAATGTCGTDINVAGTSWTPDKDPVTATNNLDFSINSGLGDAILEATSPAIDAAETPGASDHCTDVATINSLDRLSVVRPQGSICDAGSNERIVIAANIWVDSNGGTCTDSATLVVYSDSAACGSLDAANDTCENGDIVYVKTNAYPSQDITGSNSRSSACTIQEAPGETATTTSIWLRDTTNWLTIKDISNIGGVTGHNGGDCFNGSVPDVSVCVHGDNIILDNVDVPGPYAHVDLQTNNSVWKNSDFGTEGNTQSIDCDFNDQQPITISGSTNLLIDKMNFWEVHGDDPTCDIHIETFRLWDGSDGVTISNSYFVPESGDNTARISSSAVHNCETTPPDCNKNIRIINNFFGEHLSGLAAPDVFFGDNRPCEGWVIAYNFLSNGVIYNCSTQLNNISVGNMGTNTGGCLFSGTGAVNTDNLWSATSHGTCAGDAWVNGTCASFVCNYSTYNLAGDGYHLTATSPSINAGETTRCNTYTGLLDFEGDSRTGDCDAGPDEYVP
jgi:hypothetical protein